MKNVYAILLAGFFTCSSAFAEGEEAAPAAPQPETAGQVVADVPAATEAASSVSAARLAALYSSASTGKFEGSIANLSFDGQDNFNGGAGGLAVEYVYRRNGAIGFSGGVSYEGQRKMESWSYTVSDGVNSLDRRGEYLKARTLTVLYPSANANYSFGSSGVYALAGLNYSMPSFSTTGADSLKGNVGWQVGLGAAIWKGLDIDLLYQTVNFKYSDDSAISWGGYRMSGAALRLGYRI